MQQLKDTSFIKLITNITPQLLSGLIELGISTELEDLLQNAKLMQFTTLMLTVCSQLVYVKDLHECYISYGVRLFTDIGFSFLRTMKTEKEEMVDNPSEFIKLALDVWDRQKFAHIKSQAAKFIETLADKLTGMFIPVCSLCCDLLEYAIFKDPNMDNYPILKDNYNNCKVLMNLTDEDLIDVSITILTMVSYALPKDDALKARFIQAVEKTTKPIMDRNSLMLNCRLTCLLGYYIDILYKTEEHMFFEVIKMFISSLNQGEETQALAYQSSDTLNTIINDNDIIPRVKPIISDIIKSIAPAVLTVKIPDFFDCISEIFKYYHESITAEDFNLLLEHLVKRIDTDVNKSKGEAATQSPFQIKGSGPVERMNDHFTTTTGVNKWWSIIISILETDHYIENYLEQIEDQLKYLFGLLSDPSRIEFDDDIVKSMKIIITKSGKVSDVMKILFPYLKKTFEKHKFIYSELFDLIKAYWKTDKEFIFSNPNHVQDIFGFGVETLFNEDHCANGAVYLVQLFLMLKDDNCVLTQAIVPEVLSQVLKRIECQPINKIIKRMLFGVILASMVNNYKSTFQYLEANNLTEKVMDQILKFGVKKMDNNLERKLFSVSLTSLLTQSEMPASVMDSSPKIITKIVNMLIKTTVEEARKARKREKKKLEYKEDLDSDFDSDLDESSEGEDLSDEDDDKENEARANNPLAVKFNEDNKEAIEEDDSTEEEHDDDLLESEIDVQSNFAIMKTGFNSFDEFNYFKHVISELYKNHQDDMSKLIAQLSENCQKSLKALIQVQQFDNEGTTIHRRFVNAKRRSRFTK
jgi:hypothetical protein